MSGELLQLLLLSVALSHELLLKHSAATVNIIVYVTPTSHSHTLSLSLTGRWPIAVHIHFAFIAIFTISFGRFL